MGEKGKSKWGNAERGKCDEIKGYDPKCISEGRVLCI